MKRFANTTLRLTALVLLVSGVAACDANGEGTPLVDPGPGAPEDAPVVVDEGTPPVDPGPGTPEDAPVVVDEGPSPVDPGPDTPEDTPVVADEGPQPNTPCDGLTDSDCVQVHRGESVFYRRPSQFESLQINDRDTPRTVIRLTALIDAEVTDDPTAWRYQFIGVDNYTFGGFANWAQLQQGYMEVGSRRVIWEPALELPDSWRVKDTWRVVLSPAGGGS